MELRQNSDRYCAIAITDFALFLATLLIDKIHFIAGNISDPDTYTAINPPVVVKPKDKKKIRKAREQKLIQQQLLKAKLEKKKITDIHR